MATYTSSVTRSIVLLTVAAVAGGMTACTPRPDGPEPTAHAFFADLGKGDTAAAAALSDHPDDARTAINQAWSGLQAAALDAQILGSKYTQDTGSVNYRYTWHLPKDRTWTYDGRAQHDPRGRAVAGPVEHNGSAPQPR